MMLLPEVKEIYEKHHQDGLEVIGVSLDDDVAKVKKTCERMSLNWPQVIVPDDEKQRNLWYETAGIQSIPRVFVIGRDGILIADSPLALTMVIKEILRISPAGVKKTERWRQGVANQGERRGVSPPVPHPCAG